MKPHRTRACGCPAARLIREPCPVYILLSTTFPTHNSIRHQRLIDTALIFVRTDNSFVILLFKVCCAILGSVSCRRSSTHSHWILMSSEVEEHSIYPARCQPCDHFNGLATPSHPRIQKRTCGRSAPLTIAQTWKSRCDTYELRRICLQVAVFSKTGNLDTAVLLILDCSWYQYRTIVIRVDSPHSKLSAY